jgi:hypothetical protein
MPQVIIIQKQSLYIASVILLQTNKLTMPTTMKKSVIAAHHVSQLSTVRKKMTNHILTTHKENRK